MSQRDVVQEGERVPDEKHLVELNRAVTSEYPSVSEAIKSKQEQTNSTIPTSYNRYFAVFQWILLIFCVLSNIYLLSKPDIKCDCDGSSADSLVTNPSPLPTASPQVIPSLLTTSLQPSSQPITDHDPTDGPSVIPSMDPTLSPSSQPTKSPSIGPSFHPTIMPTARPTSSPSKYPTAGPSAIPSMDPTLAPSTQPTKSPTMQPSAYPSESPTYFDGYFIADYKYSFRNASHGFWVMCHGQWLDKAQYSMLFNEIGYQFGQWYDSTPGIAYFRLPDARDSVMGVIGSEHQMNENVGNETHELSESEIPEHAHYFGSGAGNGACSNSPTGAYLAQSCNDIGSPDYSYRLQRTTIQEGRWQTTMVGGNGPFSIMQPTKFIGNLFMYSGVMH